jgi:DNA polymerase-3 subunit delta
LTATPAAVRRQIAAGKPDPVYLLLGDDDVEKAELVSALAGLVPDGLEPFNVERVHAVEMTNGEKVAAGVSSLMAAARTLPMMSPWRVVIVLQAEAMLAPRRESEASAGALEQIEEYLERPERQTILVLVASSVDRRSRVYKQLAKQATVVMCGVLESQAEAEQWIQARAGTAGAVIDAAATRLLAARAGTDLKRLRGDLDRLLLYALGQARITVDDVKEIAGPSALQDDWALTTAIEQGRTAEALRHLASTLDAGAPPELVLGQLAWLVRSKFPVFGAGQLAGAVEAVFRTDLDLKRSAGAPRVLLERLVVELGDRRQLTAAMRVVKRDL